MNKNIELQLGTEVEIVGPSNSGGMSRTGKKFVISEILTRIDSRSYSTDNLSWYPASSLRVVQKFKKGDRVYCEHGESVICPGNWNDKKTGTVNDPDYTTEDGTKCVIVNWDDNSKRTSVMAEDLRLVDEELKIGDWVEVIGLSIFNNRSQLGRTFQIQYINKDGKISLDDGDWLFLPNSLRKLTPEEIKQFMQPVAVVPTIESNAKRLDAHREEMDAANERLSAIEQRQSAICSYNIETEQRLQKLEAVQKLLSQLEIRQDNHGKRLADVEYILSEIEKRLELIK